MWSARRNSWGGLVVMVVVVVKDGCAPGAVIVYTNSQALGADEQQV
jgi:hypothetical protein